MAVSRATDLQESLSRRGPSSGPSLKPLHHAQVFRMPLRRRDLIRSPGATGLFEAPRRGHGGNDGTRTHYFSLDRRASLPLDLKTVVLSDGLEPSTFRLSGGCTNQLCYKNLASTTGLEPVVFGFAGRRTFHCTTQIWCCARDSNSHYTVSKTAFSASWNTAAWSPSKESNLGQVVTKDLSYH